MNVEFSPYSDWPPVEPWMFSGAFVGDLDELDALFHGEAWLEFFKEHAQQEWAINGVKYGNLG